MTNPGAPQAGFEVSASSSALLGAPVEVAGTARFPERFVLSSDLAGNATGPFTITKIELGPARASGGVKTQPVRLTVVPFDLGPQVLPALPWKLTAADGSSQTLKSPPVTLYVSGPRLEQGDIRDIKPPLAPPLWPFLLWGVVLAAAAALIIREVRRRLKSAGAGGGTPESLDLRPPHVRALEALERLGAEDIPPKEFYIRLSDILRIYLEGRFGIPAMFLTTQDLNRRMREAEMDRAVVSPVKDLFERADLVKFAKFMPEKRERDGDLGIARDIILKTAPPEPPAKSIDKRGNGGYNQGQAGEKINE